jgi:membrane-associated protease RseP (regulator of RpoE activity)
MLDIEMLSFQLREEIRDILEVQGSTFRERYRAIVFEGKLLRDPDSAFHLLKQRFIRYSYIPWLTKNKNLDVVMASPAPKVSPSNPVINLILFIATIATTLIAGAALEGYNLFKDPSNFTVGIPFSLALMTIFGLHEFGHYLVSRRYGIEVTLPYFIPVPFGLLGTFGAFIKMKSPIDDRKALFDVGIAGPLAGLIIALPCLIYGLKLSQIVPHSPTGNIFFGDSLLTSFISKLIFRGVPEGYDISLHPIAFAGWVGLLLTTLNLLPAGQLDGGHVAYALLGRNHQIVARLIFITLLGMGIFLWKGWFVWTFLILLLGLRHPPPLNDLTELDTGRKILGVIVFIIFILLFVPVPFRIYW